VLVILCLFPADKRTIQNNEEAEEQIEFYLGCLDHSESLLEAEEQIEFYLDCLIGKMFVCSALRKSESGYDDGYLIFVSLLNDNLLHLIFAARLHCFHFPITVHQLNSLSSCSSIIIRL
jgi:hypothetical protein